MEYEVVRTVHRIGAIVADPGIVFVSLNHERPATFEHGLSFFVQVGSGDCLRSSHHDLIGTFLTTTTVIPGNKQVVVTVLPENERSFDRCIPGLLVGQKWTSLSFGDGVINGIP